MNRILITALLLTACCGLGISQSPTPTASPVNAKMSELLAKKLEGFDPRTELPRENREQAYTKLMQAQRYIWQASRMRSQAGVAANIKLARTELQKCLELNPGVAEAYSVLAESWVNPSIPPNDVDEAVTLASMATRLNKNNFGGHRLLARLYTYKSRLNNGDLDNDFAVKAIAEWKEVARLDPRNAEAWAFLSELYNGTDKPNERIEALRKWLASSPPLDRQFYQSVMHGQDDLSPENASKKLGPALLKAGRTKEAVEVLGQLIADEPDDPEAAEQLKEALESADAKTAATAVEALQQAVYANPGSLALLNLLAEVEAKAGDVEGAVKRLDAASKKAVPSDRTTAASLQVSIGDLYSNSDKFTDAAAAYEKALTARGLDKAMTLDPDEREFAMAVFDKLITVYKRANRIEDAKAIIQRARKLFGSEDLFADRQLISLYQDTGNKTEALAVVQTLRVKNADDVSLLRLEATLLGETGQVDKGVELIKKRMTSSEKPGAANAPPRLDDDFSNYLFISQLYEEAGRGSDAISAAEQAHSVAENAQQRQIAKMMLASSQQTAGKFAEAEATLRDILKQTPSNPIALNNLGYFLLERGERFPEALELIQKAVKTDPTNPSFLDSLGWAYFKLGKLDEAEKYLAQAAALDFGSGTIQEHLGDVYQKQGKVEQARSAWRRATQLLSKSDDTARVKGKLAALK
jgi:tetratricopeptide (TPR) repeat protein